MISWSKCNRLLFGSILPASEEETRIYHPMFIHLFALPKNRLKERSGKDGKKKKDNA